MENSGASALARKLAPQDVRTFFVTTSTWGRRSLFQTERMCELMMNILRVNREKGRFTLHEFVLMLNHVHFILTPAPLESLEKCVQYIKGAFSFRAKRELGFNGAVWQSGFNEHRIVDARDYAAHVEYIHQNPVKAQLVGVPAAYVYSSASGRWELDPVPEHLRMNGGSTGPSGR